MGGRVKRLSLAAALAALLVLPAQAGGIRFREAAEAVGIDFVHEHGGTGEFYMIETMGSGVVAFDYDLDGDQDLVFVQSGALPLEGDGSGGPVLYRNDGEAGFVDVTARAGLASSSYGMGGTAADIDQDGDSDLYVTAFGVNRLFTNRGDGTFADTTASSGVGDPSWSASASFADVDSDNDPDLYVTNYVDFTFDDNPLCGIPERQLRSYCHPDVYDGLPDRFYRNRGDGTFEDATAAAGFGSASGKGLGVVFGDVDDDGAVDLYVANDMVANFLFRNLGDGVFEEIALVSGAAFDDRGDAEAGMGLEFGDIDDNGYPDILVTHLDQQTNAYYSNTGNGLFIDRRYPSKLAEPSFHKVGFGIGLADFDHDGALDVAIANGHIIHNVDEWGTTTSFKQRNQLLRNEGDGTFEEIEAGLDVVRSSRGLALVDLEGDGDLDLAISNSTDPAEVYFNVTDDPGGWLMVEPTGDGALGSSVAIVAGGRRQIRQVRAASSYLSQGASAVHFGLGGAGAVERVEIRFADGARRALRSIPPGRKLMVAR